MVLYKVKLQEASKTHNIQVKSATRIKKECIEIPGNLFGFLIGTNFAPIANAMGGPNIKPLASTPEKCHQ